MGGLIYGFDVSNLEGNFLRKNRGKSNICGVILIFIRNGVISNFNNESGVISIFNGENGVILFLEWCDLFLEWCHSFFMIKNGAILIFRNWKLVCIYTGAFLQ